MHELDVQEWVKSVQGQYHTLKVAKPTDPLNNWDTRNHALWVQTQPVSHRKFGFEGGGVTSLIDNEYW